MGKFTLRSGNTPVFKEIGSSPFTKIDVADIKPDLGGLGDKLKGDGGGLGLKDKLSSKGGGPKINIKKPSTPKLGGGKKDLIKTKAGVTGGVEKTKFKVDKKSTEPKTPKKPEVKKPKAEVKKTEAPKKPVKEESFAKDTKGMTAEQQATAYTDMIEGKAADMPEKKSFIDTHKDTAQKYLNTASMVPGPVGKVAGLGSAAIDYRDAYKAWQSGDTDLMKSELASGTTSAVFSGLGPTKQLLKGSNIAKNIGNKAKLDLVADASDAAISTGIDTIREGSSPEGATTS